MLVSICVAVHAKRRDKMSRHDPECKTTADSCAHHVPWTNTTSVNITKNVFDKTWKRRGDCGSRPHRQRALKIDSSKLVLSDKLGRSALSHWPTSNYNTSTERRPFNIMHCIIQPPEHAKRQVVTDCTNEAIMTDVTNCSCVQSELKPFVYACVCMCVSRVDERATGTKSGASWIYVYLMQNTRGNYLVKIPIQIYPGSSVIINSLIHPNTEFCHYQ